MDFQREQDNNYNKKYTHASESMNWRSMADNNKNFLDSSSLVSDNRRDNDDFTHESVHMSTIAETFAMSWQRRRTRLRERLLGGRSPGNLPSSPRLPSLLF